MTLTTASYVIVITGCYPLIMYIFALMFLKEKLNLIRLAGVILVVAGGGIVQLTQSA
jgi:drug/metabolite transporter (DMT)-like permease